MTAKLKKKKNEKWNQEVTASIKYRLELYDYIYIYLSVEKLTSMWKLCSFLRVKYDVSHFSLWDCSDLLSTSTRGWCGFDVSPQ